MKILVTGGAGYIGSVVSEQLLSNGYEVLVADNFQQGHREAVQPECEIAEVDLRDCEAIDRVFKQHNIYAVMHLAADSIVGASMTNPEKCFRNNIAGGMNLLDAMLHNSVHYLVFSSSAAVYGSPETTPMNENHPKNPVNAYGESKLIFERLLSWYGSAHDLKYVALRYFNAAGATKLSGEDHAPETHLIPNILRSALVQGNVTKIFGTDYPTKDGTCIRDYVHVSDIAKAHTQALSKIDALESRAYNLGNGGGYSVLDVVESAKKVTGSRIATENCPRRQGDPATLVASSDLARKELGWQPGYPELDKIVETAWAWMKNHPAGY
jgi:UDP-glucose 4-epimerase